jgi:CBS domain-containing protein
MRDGNIGDIIVLEEGSVSGIVTDRDIVVRVIADGRDPGQVPLRDICSTDLTLLSPTDKVSDAVRLMRERAIRRLPVVQEGRPVGVVSIGDLAMERDERSALADISAAPPNQ